MSLNYRPGKENRVPPVAGYMSEAPAVPVGRWNRFAVVAAGAAVVGLILFFGEVSSDVWQFSKIFDDDNGFDPSPLLQLASLAFSIFAVVCGSLSLPRREQSTRGRRWGIAGLVLGVVSVVLLVLWSDGYGLDLFISE